MSAVCPFAARVAVGLADPAGRLAPDLSAHLPTCPACRAAAAEAIRHWPTAHSPSLPEWLSEPTGDATLSEYQARAIAAGRLSELDLGPYLLLDRLGAGGMGEVFRARHNLLRRIDAVKTVRPEFAANPNAIRRFLREAESAAKLRHPNVVQVYTADRSGAGYYIAMEFVAGSDLGKLARSVGRMPVAEACEYVRQAAEGLQHAFVQGLVHRDVKPGNILVTADQRAVKVTDFGVARAFTSDTAVSEFTATGAILGTTDYMAPEQAEDAHSADTRSDVYSLGCTLYYLLAGQAPFPGGSLRDKLNQHATAGIPPLSGFRTDVPRLVETIVRKCMAKRPEERFQTPAELAAALAAVLVPTAIPVDVPEPLPATAAFHPAPATEPLPLPVEEPALTHPGSTDDTRRYEPPPPKFPWEDDRSAPPAGFRPRQSGRPWAWVAAALLVAAGAVGLGLYLTRDRKPEGEQAKQEPPKPNTNPGPGATPPKAVAGGNWKPVGEFTSSRTDKVVAIGFGANGEVIAGRAGGKEDGSDSGWWEVWSPTGGNPIRSVRPKETRDWEQPLGVAVGGRFAITDRLLRFNPADGFALLPPLDTDLNGYATGATAGDTNAVSFSADGGYMFGSVNQPFQGKNYRLVAQWDTDTGKIKTAPQLPTGKDIVSVAADRTGRHFAAWSTGGKLCLRNVNNTLVRDWETAHAEDTSTAVAITPDARTVYAGHGKDNAIYAWDVETSKRGVKLECSWHPCPMSVSPDGRWLVACGYGVRVWDLTANPPKAVDLLQEQSGNFKAVAFSPGSKRLAVGGLAESNVKNGIGNVWVWELTPSTNAEAVVTPPAAVAAGAWKPTGEFKSTRRDRVRAVGFSAKGELIGGRIGSKEDGSDCGWWEMWPAGGGMPTISVQPKDTIPFEMPIGVSPDGQFVVSDRLRRWDPSDGFKSLPPLAADLGGYVTGARAEVLTDVTFSGDGEHLVACLNIASREKFYPLVVEWKTGTGAIPSAWQITETKEEVYSVATNKGGDHIAVWGREGRVWVRDTNIFKRDWDTVRVKDRVTGVAMTSDTKTVFVGHAKDEAIYAWDVKENKRGMRLECPWQPYPLVLSPDDRWLVAGGGGVRIFDLSANPPTYVDLWKEWSGDFRAITFSPDGKRLVVGGSAKIGESIGVGGLWVWELKP